VFEIQVLDRDRHNNEEWGRLSWLLGPHLYSIDIGSLMTLQIKTDNKKPEQRCFHLNRTHIMQKCTTVEETAS
jgi:hypothetical protein